MEVTGVGPARHEEIRENRKSGWDCPRTDCQKSLNGLWRLLSFVFCNIRKVLFISILCVIRVVLVAGYDVSGTAQMQVGMAHA
jgi:hypothetical protein